MCLNSSDCIMLTRLKLVLNHTERAIAVFWERERKTERERDRERERERERETERDRERERQRM